MDADGAVVESQGDLTLDRQPSWSYGSVSVVAVLLGGGPAGSVSVTRCDSLRIRPFRRALLLTCPSWLPAPDLAHQLA
jgi:hypothetical protein